MRFADLRVSKSSRFEEHSFRKTSKGPAAVGASNSFGVKRAGLALGLLVTLGIAFGLHKTFHPWGSTERQDSSSEAHVSLSLTPIDGLIKELTPSPTPSQSEPVRLNPERELTPQEMIDRWQSFIEEASAQFEIPQSWIRAVIRQESGGRTHVRGEPIVSKAGAMGLMQLLPQTYRDMQTRYGLGTDIFDPRNNIMAGTAYLRTLYKQFGFPFAFAAYNTGPRHLNQYLKFGRALPLETRNYIVSVVRMIGNSDPGSLTKLGQQIMRTKKVPGSKKVATVATKRRRNGRVRFAMSDRVKHRF
jgi:hypothetical protein